MNKPLPPVGATVMVRNSDGRYLPCIVTESPCGPPSIAQCGYGDRNRRISVRGVADPKFRIGGIVHRDENIGGAKVWYFEHEPTADPAPGTA